MASSWLWGPTIYDAGYYNYVNPYVAEPTVIQVDNGPQVVVDYTQPLPTEPIYIDNTQPAADAPLNAAPAMPEPDETGLSAYEEARNLFYDGAYDAALAKANLALSKLPRDSTLHQFRALCLFAEGDYRSAAAAINSVLSVGPGWDWTTLSSLYASTDEYTRQLRQLEAFSDQNPKAGYAHFLLAYHYITCGYTDEAISELQATVELEPTDGVAANLLNMLQPEEIETPEASRTAAKDFDVQKVFGSWKASPNPSTTIELTLDDEGKFKWIANQAGNRTTILEGDFSMADDKLVLEPTQGGGPLAGIVTLADNGGFNFKVAGSPPGDKGLDFGQM